MELHTLLQRQLKKIGLSSDSIPDNLKQWETFLKHINMTYIEFDQERYLNERSINISSRELLGLNEKLENAQHIAQLGYWVYNDSTHKMILSKEFLTLLGLDSTISSLNLKDFMHILHSEDRNKFMQLTKKTPTGDVLFEIEVRILHADKQYRWFQIIRPMHKTSQLITSLTGIAMNITNRKLAELEISDLNQKLMIASRQAGMADIAVSILHNVGNVLNSANVSLGMLQENINQEHFRKLTAVLQLLKTHKNKIIDYLTTDAKGQLVPRYLIAISDAIKNDIDSINQEINNLTTNLHHIREIVAMQQNYAGISGIVEKIFLPEVVDAALQMCGYLTFPKNIEVKKEYLKTPFLMTDKSKVLQILVNLIRNAKESVMLNHEKSIKRINLSITKNKSDKNFEIEVVDNGVGISKENITKIFSLGVTSKANGHGIGLHTSALSAKELGGNLKAESNGPGQGAIFTLSLPANTSVKDDANETKQ